MTNSHCPGTIFLAMQVARSSDSEETKSAKFCTSGTLSSEGWHTFYYCS